MHPKYLLILGAWLLLGFTMSATGAPVSVVATQAFNRAMAAFQTRQFCGALADFLEARREGLDNTQLTYDLGVTHFCSGETLRRAKSLRGSLAYGAEGLRKLFPWARPGQRNVLEEPWAHGGAPLRPER